MSARRETVSRSEPLEAARLSSEKTQWSEVSATVCRSVTPPPQVRKA